MHFEGKGGVQKILTDETLKKVLQKEHEWYQLPEDCKNNTTKTIAATSALKSYLKISAII